MNALLQTGSSLSACGHAQAGGRVPVPLKSDFLSIDLLFFNRDLQCLVAVELKRGKFKPSYLGQLNFYLSALDEQVKKPNENQSIGIILCHQAKRTVVELAVRDFRKPMGVAVYRTANKVPKPYQSLVTVMDGVRQILLSDDQQKEEQK